MIPIAKFLHEKCDKPLLAINSNLSNPLGWWKDNYIYFQDVVASYHIEFIKYKKYIEAFVSMDPNDSFVVGDYKIVDSVRRYAWLNKITCKFRSIKKNEFRIFKI